jgi:hypothetical protein
MCEICTGRWPNSSKHVMQNDIFTLKKITAVFAETFDNTQRSTWLNPKSARYTVKGCVDGNIMYISLPSGY